MTASFNLQTFGITMRFAMILGIVFTIGCGGGLAGTYSADARLMEGREDPMEAGYSLDEIRGRISGGQRTLTLLRGGRFEWNTGGGFNEGTWRKDGNQLILRDDTVGGIKISPALQSDRNWEIRPNGELISTGSYNAYNIEEFYTPN
jgi:hypothetical protein